MASQMPGVRAGTENEVLLTTEGHCLGKGAGCHRLARLGLRCQWGAFRSKQGWRESRAQTPPGSADPMSLTLYKDDQERLKCSGPRSDVVRSAF